MSRADHLERIGENPSEYGFVVRPGDLVYYRTVYGGYLPCKLISFGKGRGCLLRSNVNRWGFKRGEVFSASSNWIVHRSARIVRSGVYRTLARTIVREN